MIEIKYEAQQMNGYDKILWMSIEKEDVLALLCEGRAVASYYIKNGKKFVIDMQRLQDVDEKTLCKPENLKQLHEKIRGIK